MTLLEKNSLRGEHILLTLFTNITFGGTWQLLIKHILLRCIRPPQSQSWLNNSLKTSVFIDVSQHLHETNRINIFFYIKSLRNFFLRTLKKMALWSFFHVWKPCFWIFSKKKLSFNAYIWMPSCAIITSSTKLW